MVMVARRHAYCLAFDPEVEGHLHAIETKYHSLIRRTIREHLLYEPETETRNRKSLRQPAALAAR